MCRRKTLNISYTLDSASVHQKVKPKFSAVSPHNNRLRPYWSFPLIKKMLQKTLHFSAFVYWILFSCIKEDLLSTLSISAIQNTQTVSTLRERPAPAIRLQFSPAHSVGCTIECVWDIYALEAQERSTIQLSEFNSYEIPHNDLVSVARDNALTACATLASPLNCQKLLLSFETLGGGGGFIWQKSLLRGI